MSSVSVIVPVRNGERYLPEALRSVLGGTCRPDEIVVVDDGSTDATAEVALAAGGPVRVISQEPLGQGAALNRGVAEADGEVLGFIDADDLWLPRKLEIQLARLDGDPELEAAFGHVVEFATPEEDPAGAPLPPAREGVFPARLRGALLARRQLFERVGPFAVALRAGEFVDWYARAQEAGVRDVMLDDVVLRRRIHSRNLGRLEPGSADYVRVARAALRRRREAQA